MRKAQGIGTLVAVALAWAGTAEANRYASFSPDQTSITVGGGVNDFAFGTMRRATEVGAEWDARITFGTRTPIAFEAGYVGTYNKLAGPTEGQGSVAPYLMQHSVDGDLRINLLPFRVQPYIFGGVGYNHVNLRNRGDNPALAARFNDSDDNLLVPAGAGLAGYVGRHGTMDVRFTYRAIFFRDLDRVETDSRGDQWVVAGRFGYAF
jgi:hypothetical protein